MPSTKSLVLALALTAPAAALVPPTTQRVPATIRHADDAARAARREALMQASERAAARIEATRNSGQSTPMRPDDMMAFVKPATEQQAPDEMSYVPTDDEGRANYAVGGGESGMDRSSMKERFSRAPEGHTPHYNTGEGYFADLTRDSSERHWTKNDGKTAGYDTIKRQFGQRPDEDIEIDMSDTFLVNQLKVGERYEVKPAWEVYYEKAIAEGRDTLEVPKARPASTPKPAAPSGYAAARAAAAAAAGRAPPAAPPAPAPAAPAPPPPAPVAAAPPPPAPAAPAPPAPPAAPVERDPTGRPVAAAPASGAALEGEDQQVVQGALSALMQYAGSVQLDSPLPPQVQGQVADQIKRARDVMVAEATDAPAAAAAPPPVAVAAPPPAPAAAPAPPAPAAAAPPAAPAKTEVHLGNRGSSLEPALATLDAAGVAARVAAIGPGFSQFAAAIEELACDGAFLASLTPAELDETFEDIGVTARLQRRRVAFALGLGK